MLPPVGDHLDQPRLLGPGHHHEQEHEKDQDGHSTSYSSISTMFTRGDHHKHCRAD